MTLHPLTNFEIQKYYQIETKFNGFVYTRNSLPKIKDGAYVINLGMFKSIEAHWIALYMNGNNVIHLDNLGVEHIPKDSKNFIENKNIIRNIYIIQVYDSIMWGYFFVLD